MNQQNNPQKPDSMMDPNQPVNQPAQNSGTDNRDEMIKNEQDTARIRSERQSVIDGEHQNNSKQQ